MNVDSRRAWVRPVVGLVIAAMIFVGGCSGKRYTMPVSPDLTSMPSFEPTPSDPPPGPVKYGLWTFKNCSEIQQAVPDLSSPLPTARSSHNGWHTQTCDFTVSKDHGPYVTFNVELHENWQAWHGNYSGAELAEKDFNRPPLSGKEEETSLNLGSQARWDVDLGVSNSCKLEILDENAEMFITYYPLQDIGSEQCRERARTIAKQIYDAVQPQ
ncbi:hypothetical protein [Saccharopolyspora thermophila]|uniref:DUF3558 domain-containing protein n=1 Tax=Saccharopolyspora thermophila TaxID=89367 RepID=A0ABN1D3P4_9PSEU